jgi:DNA-binding response OmpR family regulator
MYTSSLLALEAFRATPDRFALVVTDNTMPHLTGLELVRRIRGIRADVPVMMVSGVGAVMPIEQLQESGVQRLLPKPYQSSELRAAALELLHANAQNQPAR